MLATVLAALMLGVSSASERTDRGESSTEAGAAGTGDRGKARIALLTRGQRALLSRGRLVMRLRYGHVGRVRVFVRSPRRSARPARPIALVRGRSFRFREAGAQRISFPLTSRGRRLVRAQLRDCRSIRVIATTRARRFAITSALPPFARENRARRSREARSVRRLRPGGTRCGGRDEGRRRGGTPGGGDPGPGPPGAGGGDSGRGSGGGSGSGPGSGSGGGPGGDPGGGDPGPNLLRAGAAESDITPPIGTPMFAYTSRSLIANPGNFPALANVVADPGSHSHVHAKTFVPSEGIHTRVNARALVLERDGEKLALVQTDLGGLPYALAQEVVDRIEEQTGITLDRLMLSATHTHASTGPIWPGDSGGYGVLGGDLFDPRIFDLTADGIAEAILEADGKLERARLGVATTEVRDASRNRNFDPPFLANDDVPDDREVAEPLSIDPDLSVIRVDAVQGDRPLAVWSNFAIHPTSFGGENLLFSGDNAGFSARIAEQAIEDEAGGSDVVNVWTNGNEGDISPNGSPDSLDGEALQHVTSSYGSAHMAGLKVARGTVRAWREAGSDMTRTPELSVERALLDFRRATPTKEGEPVSPTPVLGAGGITAPDGTCAPADDAAGPGQGSKLFQASGPLAPLEASVSVAQIGPLGVAALPFEITRQMGKRIRDTALAATGGDVDRMALAGMTNGYLSYTATPEEYEECHYEGSFTLFGEHQGPRLSDFAEGLTVALFEGGDGPAAGIEPLPTGFTADETPPERTPNAGTPISQPAATVTRRGRATFSWFGGDPTIDAPRGEALVTLERETASGEWIAVGTDEGFRDTTRREMGGTWVETWQFSECDPLGTYRFSVTGVADKGDGEGPKRYSLDSDPFTLTPVEGIALGVPSVSGGVARVRATYPSPGPESLLALPRFLRTGSAALRVNGEPVEARPEPGSTFYAADVPRGSTVTAVGATDACDNSVAAG